MVTVIAAIGEHYELGKDNDLIWHLPADLKRFKQTTSGHHIIMGRKTFESIGKPLPNRTSIIITRDINYSQEGCLVAHTIEQAIEMANGEDVFIIGGAEIYKQTLAKQLADVLDITQVHGQFDADVFFPSIEPKEWELVSREDFKADVANQYDYSFLQYRKKTI